MVRIIFKHDEANKNLDIFEKIVLSFQNVLNSCDFYYTGVGNVCLVTEGSAVLLKKHLKWSLLTI